MNELRTSEQTVSELITGLYDVLSKLDQTNDREREIYDSLFDAIPTELIRI